MKKIGLFTILLITAVCFSAQADSLGEISKFAKEICDEISVEGEITKKQIEGKLQGEVKGIAKLLGASISADGKILIDDMQYRGLPYEDVPDQMTDARDCRKQLATILIQERNKITADRESGTESGLEEVWKAKRGNWNFSGSPFFVVGEQGFNKAYLSGSNFSNLIYEVRIRKVSNNDGPIGLLVRYDEVDDAGYLLLVWPHGDFQFSRLVGEERRPIGSGSPETMRTGTDWNTIKIIANGTNFDISINNINVITLSDEEYLSGKVGLIIHGGAKNKAEFKVLSLDSN